MLKKNWLTIFLALTFIYIATTKFSLIKSLNYNQDEIDYTGNSLLWSEYKLNYSPKLWSLPWAYDQPHLYHFILGIFVKQQTLVDLGFNDRYPQDLQYMVRWNKNCIGNYYTSNESKCLIISRIRIFSFVFYFLCLTLISLISYKILGNLGLFFSLLLFYFNRNFDNNLITAVPDSLLSFFILLSIFLWLNNGYKLMAIQAIIAGLALSTKINGGILLLFLNLFLFNQKVLPSIKKALLINTAPWIIFIILNPYLWQNTIARIFKMISYRFIINENFAYFRPFESPPNNYILDKIFFNSQRLLDFSHPSSLSSIVYFACLFLSTYLLIFSNKKLPKFTQTSLIIFSCLQLITLSYISIYWGRYFILAQIGLYLNIITLLSIYKQRIHLAL